MNEIVLSENARKIFKDLYCFQGEEIEDSFRRVSNEFSESDEDKEIAYNLLAKGIWRPNTPVFLNSGTKNKVFSACYVVGLEDSMESIYDIANVARRIFQFGAGVGIPIGNLREKEAWIYEGQPEKAPEGKSSGPVSFMKLYNAVGETTKSGGRVRRAAILCSLPIWHPDVFDFIKCKEEDGQLANMNISLLVTDAYMQSLKDGIPFNLVTPMDGSKITTVDPQDIWNRIADMAHKTGDPGVLFIDTANKYNPLIKDVMIECTNPCGEQSIIPWGACNLSAINISKFVKNNDNYNWEELYETAKIITKFMNYVIDRMDYPDPRFKEHSIKFRPIGVGIMGLADVLYMMNLRYDGPEGREFAGRIMKTITTACVDASAELAEEFGPFHNYDRYKNDVERIIREHIEDDEVVMEKVYQNGVRNYQYTTAMPTGTTALSCDASYGIEPLMGLVFQKNLISGEKMWVANSIFHERFKDEEWFTSALVEKIKNNGGSLKGIHGIPKEVRDIFVVAHDISYKARIDMQAELQKYCSTAISSTVNLPKETTKEEIADLYKYAYEKGLKGITIYRDGCKQGQPVTFHKDTNGEFKRPNKLNAQTYTIDTGNGKMYVTISDDNGKPVEVFLFLGKSGQLLNTFTEGLGRILSLALQNNVPLEKITKTLRGINSDSIAWHRFEEADKKPIQILSIPDGIAKLLERYYLKREIAYKTGESSEICDKCGERMVAIEGCFSCTCGNSKCG